MGAEHREKPHWAERAVKWVARSWYQFGSALGAILLAIASAPDLLLKNASQSDDSFFGDKTPLGHWGWEQIVFLVGAALVIASLIGQLRVRPTYSQLLEERDDAISLAEQRATIMESILGGVVDQLCVASGLNGFNYRASLYCHGDASFILLVRTSRNPELRKIGRVRYPENQGVIGKAWTDGQAAFLGLLADRAAWEQQMVDQGIEPETASSLQMQSRSIVGVRIDDTSKSPPEPFGVIVLESTAPRGVTGTTLDKLAKSPVWHVLVTLMLDAREHFPAIVRSLVVGIPDHGRHTPSERVSVGGTPRRS